ncbi:N-alpha-acetyltransferase 50 [Sciurus carolinensis]|uniref:N-alpha-acetyltransferase 50 n=1 Tax=Sciurus carolinensis TaxID=30640 RepID=A0AA41ST19_SCICA|nr:N-alpha-acetyltransferase 50 [Sciurus carolinensis]
MAALTLNPGKGEYLKSQVAGQSQHVQISNESAIDFYRKFGFEIIETKKNYYKRIEPADAHVLQKNLKVPSGQNADAQKTDN